MSDTVLPREGLAINGDQNSLMYKKTDIVVGMFAISSVPSKN